MPPKKKQPEQKKNKVVVDKTFGMKNKKGAQTQKQVNLIKQQQEQADPKRRREEEARRKAQKDAKKGGPAGDKSDLDQLLRPVQVIQKVPFGTDPKTVLCINFKNGFCEKGSKCKFSHDPNVGRKTQKKDIYTDDRDEKKGDLMADWDEEKLREVVGAKYRKGPSETDIVCKFFLEAIENEKYGWLWTCPNGDNCHYKHALPKGFVLNKDRKKQRELEKRDEISLEEFLETERHKLGKNLTPITKESFEQWKKDRVSRKEKEEQDARKKAETNIKAGRTVGLSGRQMFELDSRLYQQDSLDGDDADDDRDQVWDLSEFRKRAAELEDGDDDNE